MSRRKKKREKKRGAVRKQNKIRSLLPCKKGRDFYINTHTHTLVTYSSPVSLVSPGGCDIDRHRWCLAGEKRRAGSDGEEEEEEKKKR